MFVSLFHNQIYLLYYTMNMFFQTYGDDSFQVFERIGREIEQHIQQIQMLFPTSTPQINQLHNLLEALVLVRNTREPVNSINR